MTPVFDNHLFSLAPEYPQYGPLKRISPLNVDWHGNRRGGFNQNEVIHQVNVRSARERPEHFRVLDRGLNEQRMPRKSGERARVEAKMNVSVNASCLGKRRVMHAGNVGAPFRPWSLRKG